MNEKDTGTKTRKVQAFIRINEDSTAPELVLRPAAIESHPANMVKLPGVVLEAGDPPSDKDDWKVAEKIVELCEAGGIMQTSMELVRSNLNHALSVLHDMIRALDKGLDLSEESKYALLIRARDLVYGAKAIPLA